MDVVAVVPESVEVEVAPVDAADAAPPKATYREATLILAATALFFAVWWIAECFRKKSTRWERLGPLLGSMLLTLCTVLAYLRWRPRLMWT